MKMKNIKRCNIICELSGYRPDAHHVTLHPEGEGASKQWILP